MWMTPVVHCYQPTGEAFINFFFCVLVVGVTGTGLQRFNS